MGLTATKVLASDYCKHCFAKSDRRNIEETIRKTRVRIEQSELALAKARSDLLAETSKIPTNTAKVASLMRRLKEKQAVLAAAKLTLHKNEMSMRSEDTQRELLDGAENDLALEREAKRKDIQTTVKLATVAAERHTQSVETLAQLHGAATDIRSMQATTQMVMQKEADDQLESSLREVIPDNDHSLVAQAMEFALENKAAFDIPDILAKSTTTASGPTHSSTVPTAEGNPSRLPQLPQPHAAMIRDAAETDERTQRLLNGLMNLASS